MDAEMPDRGPTVRAYLESQMAVDKAAVIDRTVENLDGYVKELKELTYDEVIGLKVPVSAAKKLQPHLKLLAPDHAASPEQIFEAGERTFSNTILSYLYPRILGAV